MSTVATWLLSGLPYAMASINPLLRLVIFLLILCSVIRSPEAEELSGSTIRHEKIVLSLTSRSLGQSLETELTLSAKSPLPANPQVEFVENPERLVIDVPGVRIRKNRSVDIETSSYVSKIRFGTHPEKLRLVLDLIPGSRPAFQSKLESGDFKLTFRDNQIGNLEKILSEIAGDSAGKHQQSFTVPALFVTETKIDSPTASPTPIPVETIEPIPSIVPPTPSALSVELLSVERVERAIISESSAITENEPALPPEPTIKEPSVKEIAKLSGESTVESDFDPTPSLTEIPTLKAPEVVAAVVEAPKATPTPISTTPIAPATSSQLQALSFGFLGSQRIPIVQIKLSAKTNYTFTKVSNTSFTLLLDRVSMAGEFLLLPQFPPQEFVGLVMVSAARTDSNGVAITFAVEDGVKLVTISDGNDLLVRSVTR